MHIACKQAASKTTLVAPVRPGLRARVPINCQTREKPKPIQHTSRWNSCWVKVCFCSSWKHVFRLFNAISYIGANLIIKY